MTDAAARRPQRLGWATLCLGLLALLAVLVGQGWSPLLRLDRDAATGPQRLTADHESARHWWVWLSHVTHPDVVLVVALVGAVALVLKGHRRAGLFTAGVMVAVRVANPLLKQLVQRPRPRFADPVATLNDYSFPSGHASGIAAAMGVASVLVLMLVRRRGLRRLLVGACLTLVVLVAADRVFLGLHYLSDVVGGLLLGAGLVMLGLALYDPTPRSIALSGDPFPQVIGMEDRTLAAILNPIKVDDAAQFKVMVTAMAVDSGFADVLWWETTAADTGYAMAHDAAVSGADLVMAIGGDGTIRAVCDELAGTGIPVGIVPAGTGNLLARNLDIPLYLRSAVDVALNGQDRAIDMCTASGDEMEDSTFLVMAGMGFDAAVMEGVNETIKARVGWVAYVWSALKSLMFPAIRVEISLDGGDFTRHRARTIVIGNVGNLQAGMPLLPDAAIDDGRLDVVLLYPRRFLSWLPLALRVVSRNKRNDETITRMTGRSVVVRTSSDAPRQLDGDLIAPGREIRAECVHGRLLVRVPR